MLGCGTEDPHDTSEGPGVPDLRSIVAETLAPAMQRVDGGLRACFFHSCGRAHRTGPKLISYTLSET